MSPTFIAAMSAIVAVAAFGLALVIHVIKYSYSEGQKDQRLKVLEAGHATLMVSFKETLERIERHFNERMDDFKRQLRGDNRDAGS